MTTEKFFAFALKEGRFLNETQFSNFHQQKPKYFKFAVTKAHFLKIFFIRNSKFLACCVLHAPPILFQQLLGHLLPFRGLGVTGLVVKELGLPSQANPGAAHSFN